MIPNNPTYRFEYVPEYQILLSKRCAFSCGYCNYPESITPPLPSPKQFRSYLRTAQRLGAHQITITAGEGLEQSREIHSGVRFFGFSSWWHYVAHLCLLTTQAKGVQPLLPVLDIGAIPNPELAFLQPYVGALRLILDYDRKDFFTDGILKAAPQKNPLIRTHAARAMARGEVPLFLGARIGIGETAEDQIDLANTVAQIQQKYGVVHSFHLIPFAPVPRSSMADYPPATDMEFKQAADIFREHLPPSITLCAEISRRLPLMPRAAASGILDLGAYNLGSNESIALDAGGQLDKAREILAKMDVAAEARPLLTAAYLLDHRVPPLVETQIRRYEEKLSSAEVIETLPPEENSAIVAPGDE